MIVFGFFTVFSPTAILIAIIGAAITGLVLGWFIPPNPGVRNRIMYGVTVIAFIGIVFFVGQGVEVYFAPGGSELWVRVAARAAIWVIFSVVLAIVGIAVQSRRWKL